MDELQPQAGLEHFKEQLLAQLPQLFERSLVLAPGLYLPSISNEVRINALSIFQEGLHTMISNYGPCVDQSESSPTPLSPQDLTSPPLNFREPRIPAFGS